MNVRVETAGPCRREVHIEVPADRVNSAFDEVVKAYSQVARIPGFRPGKAPRDLIRRRFQKEIATEVKERLIPAAYQEAMQQEKLETINVLDVKEKELSESQPFAFSITLDVQPSFDLPTYKGLAVEGEAVAVKDEDVDEVLQNIREQNARYEEVQGRVLAKGDLAQIDYAGQLDGQPVETVAAKAKGMGEGKDFWLMADEQNEFLPGFAAGLWGAQVGETRTVTVNFPATFVEPSLAGKQASYTVTVKAIREKKLPEIDDEFIKAVGADSLEAMKSRVRGDLQNMREENEKRRQQNEVARLLLQNTTLDLPESVLQEETRQQVYEMVRQSQTSGASKEDIETRKEELFDNAARTASDKIKLRYILRRIAREEKIECTQEEVEARMAMLARSWGVALEKLKADMHKRNALPQVREDVMLNKTLVWLRDQAKVTTKS
jgi:trigger factor